MPFKKQKHILQTLKLKCLKNGITIVYYLLLKCIIEKKELSINLIYLEILKSKKIIFLLTKLV